MNETHPFQPDSPQPPMPVAYTPPAADGQPVYTGQPGQPTAAQPAYFAQPAQPGQVTPQGYVMSAAPMLAEAAPPKKRKGLVWAVVLIVLALVAAGAFFIVRHLSTAGGPRPHIVDENPNVVQPSDDWINGYEEAWSISGVSFAAAHGENMVTFTAAGNGDKLEMVGYDIAGGQEPVEQWRSDFSGQFVPEYWHEGKLYGPLLRDTRTLFMIDTATGESKEVKLSSSLFSKVEGYQIAYRPNNYVICDLVAPERRVGLFTPGVIDEIKTGCVGVNYEGQEIWAVSVKELEDLQVAQLDLATGKTAKLSEISPRNDDFDINLHSFDSTTDTVHVTWSEDDGTFLYESGGKLIERYDNREWDTQGPPQVAWHMVVCQLPASEIRQGIDDLHIDEGSLKERMVYVQNDWSAMTARLRFPSGITSRADSIALVLLPSPEKKVVASYNFHAGASSPYAGFGTVNFLAAESGPSAPYIGPETPAILPQEDLLISMDMTNGELGRGKGGITAYRPKGK